MNVPTNWLVVEFALLVEFPAINRIAKLFRLVHGQLVSQYVVAFGIFLVLLNGLFLCDWLLLHLLSTMRGVHWVFSCLHVLDELLQAFEGVLVFAHTAFLGKQGQGLVQLQTDFPAGSQLVRLLK